MFLRRDRNIGWKIALFITFMMGLSNIYVFHQTGSYKNSLKTEEVLGVTKVPNEENTFSEEKDTQEKEKTTTVETTDILKIKEKEKTTTVETTDILKTEGNSDKIEVKGDLKNPQWASVYNIDRYFQMKLVKTSKDVKYVIGIPTVARKNAYYLMDTVRKLVQFATPAEKKELLIVVFVAEINGKYREKVRNDFNTTFPEEMEIGLIRLLVPPKDYYPSLNKLPAMYGDKPDRVKWRSKQSLDYSYLYYFCSHFGEYYIQLEDDVATEQNYLQKIKHFIKSKSNANWSVLEFGATGFIGMTYRTKHLKSLAKFVRFWFWTMPVDWLFRVYNDVFLYGNSKNYVLKPPVFKHIGKNSSLEGQFRKLKDLADNDRKIKQSNRNTIEEAKRNFQPTEGNPPASILTTIKSFVQYYDITKPYSQKGVFWGKDYEETDYIEIRFKEVQTVTRVVFASGNPSKPGDTFDNTKLSLAKDQKCKQWEDVSSFTKQIIVDYTFKSAIAIQCLKLTLTTVKVDKNKVKNWLIINEIAVITDLNMDK